MSNLNDVSNFISFQPHDLEIEQSILGCLLYKNSLYDSVYDTLKPEYFYSGIHSKIYAEMQRLLDGGSNATPTTVYQKFIGDNEFDQVGSAQKYLPELLGGVYFETSIKDYANLIKDLWVKRELGFMSERIKSGIKSNQNSEEIIKDIDDEILNFKGQKEDDFINAPDGWKETLQEIEDKRNGKIQNLSSSYDAIDKLINGFQGGKLYILAARPAMGKTALALNMAENTSKVGDVLVFSLEMPKSELFMRISARSSGVSVGKQMTGNLTDDEMRKVASVKMPESLTVYDRSGIDIGKICSLVRWFSRRRKAKLIVIDYLGLIQGNQSMQKVHQIEEITTRLKILAKEMDLPIILLCQLSRTVEQRDDKRPQLSDLRDSGAIEQDADVVMFLYREEYYLEKMGEPKQRERERREDYAERISQHYQNIEDSRGVAEVIIAKNRSGFTGIAKLNFDGVRQEFRD